MDNKIQDKTSHICNRDLVLPYAVPYLAYVGIATLFGGWLSHEMTYVLKLTIVPLLLFWAWKWYAPLSGPEKPLGSILAGMVFGVAGLVLWCLLMAPFIDLTAGEPWTKTAFLLHLVSATLIVPVFEELVMRGYILKAAWQWDMNRKNMGARAALEKTLDDNSIDDVPPGTWSVTAVVVSTLAFTAGHLVVEWPAAICYGLLMSILWIIRKDLISCMVAHGITNLGLALYVWHTGYWGFW